MPAAISPLLTDLYQLNMLQAYLDEGHSGSAVFEFFMSPSSFVFTSRTGLNASATRFSESEQTAAMIWGQARANFVTGRTQT